MTFSKNLDLVLNKINLDADQMADVMFQIMSGDVHDAQIGALLAGLRCKGESVTEISAAATVMRKLSEKVHIEDTENAVDTCGTGGDHSGIFNVSTASAFVAAAAGVKVAKHGNRSNTSSSGSSDVLTAAGVNVQLNAQQVAQCVETLGVGFMFAPVHHSAMKNVIGVRQALGVRTLFNILGPLTNPANPKNQVLGVYDKQWMKPMAEVLRALGSRQVLVVHSDDGIDEISIAADTQVAELKNREIIMLTISPENYGCAHSDLSSLKVNSPEESFNMIKEALNNGNDAATDIIKMNAGAAIYVSGVSLTYAEGIEIAAGVINDGSAWKKLQDFALLTQQLAG